MMKVPTTIPTPARSIVAITGDKLFCLVRLSYWPSTKVPIFITSDLVCPIGPKGEL